MEEFPNTLYSAFHNVNITQNNSDMTGVKKLILVQYYKLQILFRYYQFLHQSPFFPPSVPRFHFAFSHHVLLVSSSPSQFLRLSLSFTIFSVFSLGLCNVFSWGQWDCIIEKNTAEVSSSQGIMSRIHDVELSLSDVNLDHLATGFSTVNYHISL